MSKKEAVIKEIEQIPEPFLEEVLDFVHFLKTKIIKETFNNVFFTFKSL